VEEVGTRIFSALFCVTKWRAPQGEIQAHCFFSQNNEPRLFCGCCSGGGKLGALSPPPTQEAGGLFNPNARMSAKKCDIFKKKKITKYQYLNLLISRIYVMKSF
jgi:hypothetical protein